MSEGSEDKADALEVHYGGKTNRKPRARKQVAGKERVRGETVTDNKEIETFKRTKRTHHKQNYMHKLKKRDRKTFQGNTNKKKLIFQSSK